ncbi:hypothetical protein NLX83_20335 [Allokutzneria sp. A3M-2-11 16]|uniref:hypothetical protein n=1 Tax=Allokutzneria sp. A3M-2-11 16 TaxID=2962043 RepID=UPI0020B7BEA2|nr:hypothetical protein [Allokutzneria sp. A3M-2-11 16]MCP3801613.1 hypothetical protein [Allokutzneria sp. A3M-2-11 16]
MARHDNRVGRDTEPSAAEWPPLSTVARAALLLRASGTDALVNALTVLIVMGALTALFGR